MPLLGEAILVGHSATSGAMRVQVGTVLVGSPDTLPRIASGAFLSTRVCNLRMFAMSWQII